MPLQGKVSEENQEGRAGSTGPLKVPGHGADRMGTRAAGGAGPRLSAVATGTSLWGVSGGCLGLGGVWRCDGRLKPSVTWRGRHFARGGALGRGTGPRNWNGDTPCASLQGP